MSAAKNYLIAFLSLTTIVTGYLAWDVSRDLAELKSKPSRGPIPAAWRSGSGHRLDTAPPVSATDSESAEAREEGPARRERRGGDRRLAMIEAMGDPEIQQLMAMQRKAGLDQRYAALFRKLGLSPADLEIFKSLLAEKQGARTDVLTAAVAEGLDPRTDREALRELMASTQKEIDQSIRAKLGEAAYAEYTNYEKSLPYRNLVEQFDSRLSYGPSPLTAAQHEQMILILTDTNPSRNAPAPVILAAANLTTGVRGSVPDQGSLLNAAALNRAQGILTPDQFSALQQFQTEQEAGLQMGELMREQMAKTRSAGATPTQDSTP